MNPTIEIIQEDKDIIVCRKPAGIPVQSARLGQADMVSLLRNYRAGKQEQPEIYPVHRLDQPVEGLMVFAKNQKAAANLSKQIQNKGVDKYYRAVVEGVPASPEGTLTDYLLRDGKTNTSRVVSPETRGAKKAVLSYRVLESGCIFSAGRSDSSESGQQDSVSEAPGTEEQEGAASEIPGTEEQEGAASEIPGTEAQRSILEIHLETGRHHQIRVQMAHAGYPLVGDKKYNSNCQSGYMPIGLCSVRLAFDHPVTGKRIEFNMEPKGPAFLK